MTAKLHMFRGEGTVGQPALSSQWLRGMSIVGQLSPATQQQLCEDILEASHSRSDAEKQLDTEHIAYHGISAAIDPELNSLFRHLCFHLGFQSHSGSPSIVCALLLRGR